MIEQNLQKNVSEFVKENRDNIVRDIKRLVAVKSVRGATAENAPFGVETKEALELSLEMSRDLGLDVKNCENYIGYAEVKGKSEQYIASIAHVDVVPQGNGWKADPFIVREIDGWLIGRGVCDDKGPAVLNMYMLKYFKEHYKEIPYTLRAIFGTEEETGMGDLDYYLANYAPPVFAITPDANFPVCCGEKGNVSADLISKKITDGNVLSFNAGIASNVIPDKAYMTIKKCSNYFPHCDGIEIDEKETEVKLLANGIGGHAAMPEGTKNAIGMLVTYCLDNNLLTDSEKAYFQILSRLHSVTDGSGLCIASQDDIFSPLTCIGGMIKIEDEKFIQNINIRFPTSITEETIAEILEYQMKAVGGRADVSRASKPFYLDANAPAIQALLSAYNDVTGKNEKPYTIGGGTYARHFPSAAAFGIEPCESEKDFFPSFVGTIHGAEEGYSIKAFMEALEIMIIAMDRLMNIEF